MKVPGQVSDCGLGKKHAAVAGSGGEEIAGNCVLWSHGSQAWLIQILPGVRNYLNLLSY